MNQVSMWIERPSDYEGGPVQIEQHVLPIFQWARAEDGRPLHNPDGTRMYDVGFAGRAYDRVKDYEGQNAYDVASDLTAQAVGTDDTLALRKLAAALAEIGSRVLARQKRASQGTLRAEYLADFELARMTVRVRGE